jgi:hypothetical protein
VAEVPRLHATGGIFWAAVYSFAYDYFGRALKAVQMPIDVGIGGAALLVVVAFSVYVKRKEGELSDRAQRELPEDALDELDDAA